MCVHLIDVTARLSKIEDAVANKDKKHNIMAILSNCNVFLITLLCSFLWYAQVFVFVFFFSNML